MPQINQDLLPPDVSGTALAAGAFERHRRLAPCRSWDAATPSLSFHSDHDSIAIAPAKWAVYDGDFSLIETVSVVQA